jgi:hypothetical protein
VKRSFSLVPNAGFHGILLLLLFLLFFKLLTDPPNGSPQQARNRINSGHRTARFGALLMETSKEWESGKKHRIMEAELTQ